MHFLSTRRVLLAGIVGAAAIAGGLYWLRRGGDERGGPGADRRADRDAPPPARRLSGQDGGADHRPEVPPEPADASADFTVPPETAALVDDAHEHLQDAARPCVGRVRSKLTGKDLFVQFSYTLTVVDGQAHPADLAVQNTDMTDPALVSCMVEEMKQARWIAGAAGAATGASVTVDDTLTLGELR